MNFDLRIPVGLMFAVFGGILIGVGLFGGADPVKQSLGINMNLWWGAVQFLFGAAMLLLAFRGRKAADSIPVQRRALNRPEEKVTK